tara:strand:+ start:112 stop:264 length:153 start_codon:yes stop_codon:yes gene_type:complete
MQQGGSLLPPSDYHSDYIGWDYLDFDEYQGLVLAMTEVLPEESGKPNTEK